MKAGAVDFIEKPFASEAILNSLDTASRGPVHRANKIQPQVAAATKLALLSPRERRGAGGAARRAAQQNDCLRPCDQPPYRRDPPRARNGQDGQRAASPNWSVSPWPLACGRALNDDIGARAASGYHPFVLRRTAVDCFGTSFAWVRQLDENVSSFDSARRQRLRHPGDGRDLRLGSTPACAGVTRRVTMSSVGLRWSLARKCSISASEKRRFQSICEQTG